MQLLVVRHAIAEDREEFARSGRDDAERPLTDGGRRKMKRGARGLRRALPSLDVLATSPYARADETARIVARAYGGRPEPRRVQELVPDAKPGAFVRWLRALGPAGAAGRTVAIVGHEPHLGELVTWLLAARGPSVIELKKGAACLLLLDDAAIGAGSATLRWALTPRQLRRLGA